jgi:kynurenine formamidase
MSALELSTSEFQALHALLKRRSLWSADPRGTLNNISTADVVAAASDVWVGRTVSLGPPAQSQSAAGDPEPRLHPATMPPARPAGLDGLAGNEIVGRGLLLDIPRVRGVRWLEPGDYVTADDLAAAEDAQDVHIGQGDLLFVRVGHRRRRNELGPWDAAQARAGLHPTALELLADRQIAVLGSDGDNDTATSAVAGVDLPVHVLAISAMGLRLLDYLYVEDLVAVCEDRRRWSFLCVIAPLGLGAGTGSPVNPIAIF